ncbi:VPS10 domain-containing receptor SorCS3 [Geodia barretti]|uniref:VPS10 domain-containing receptor SorCS3 n=1 Tax=Geodia barretti TaxID=519541 RepID=A0AA35RHB5_GEOBA|nr:VPS10 domain-containing receptor SorCS3 [Geodia barretti]
MARIAAFLVCLVVLWGTQEAWGRLSQLTDLHRKPTNIVDLTFEHDGSPSELAAGTHQLLKRQTSRQPHVDGVHEFHDGHYRARIYYPGGGSQVIIVLTYDWINNVAYRSYLYRSTNYGSTFTNISSTVNNAILYQNFYVNGSTLIFVDAVVPLLFYTVDEGATFTAVDLTPSTLITTTVVYHPTRDGWMLMQDHMECCLYVTENYGVLWTYVAPNVDTFQWADGDWDDDDRRIYFNTTTSHLYVYDYPYSGVAKDLDPNLSGRDTFDTFEIVGRYIFAQRTESGMVALYVSDRRGPLQKAHIPIPGGHERYLVSHIDDMQALVIVEHAGGFYNLYLSDESGLYFSLSLTDIVIETLYNRWQIDLELIQGVNGTLIANQYAREDAASRASTRRTVISYDNGAFWSGILPPDEDLNGVPINCEPPNCTLHLQMDTSYYARLGVYSTESAPGIIVAHGGNCRHML